MDLRHIWDIWILSNVVDLKDREEAEKRPKRRQREYCVVCLSLPLYLSVSSWNSHWAPLDLYLWLAEGGGAHDKLQMC